MSAPEPHLDAAPQVRPDSHLTLHYRISLARTGDDVISTFSERPATLTLGLGQLAEPLERLLLGLREGEAACFELEPEDAYGPRNPGLLQRVSRSMLDAHGEPGARYAPGDLLDFAAPHGGRYAGVVREVDETGALLDFNHPLAGQPIRFEVRILGVL
jgi:FKBP-type peptidyl-prolyl cis-trans isomerase SlpA